MKIFFAADHAGFDMKNELLAFVRDMPMPRWAASKKNPHYEVEDCGAFTFDERDDYPLYTLKAAKAVARDPLRARAIVLGASGQGEAMAANRVHGVRAVVYYGPALHMQVDASGVTLDILASTRAHNDANVLSIGSRFVTAEEAREAVRLWLDTPFSDDERHTRRIAELDRPGAVWDGTV